MIGYTLGGLGIFLLGVNMLTEGSRGLGQRQLRNLMQRFVRGRFSALATGSLVTALVQSSSATTVATIGFVSAGILNLSQALGLIFGANLGTTSTGWLVSLIGLKYSVTGFALPIVGSGSLMLLFLEGRWKAAGKAVAGFGLIFVGIDFMQVGMQGLAADIDPAAFPRPDFPGSLYLVLIGIGLTIALQSSSAAMAITLTALHTGTLSFEQATLLVIGQNMGTTVTAFLASIKASIPARRAAVGHILFNLVSGLLALLCLPLLMECIVYTKEYLVYYENRAIDLAYFHSLFNLLGILVWTPFMPAASRLLVRAVPEKNPELTRHLDQTIRKEPLIALEAVRNTLLAISVEALRYFQARLVPDKAISNTISLQDLQDAIDQTRQYLSQIPALGLHNSNTQLRLSLVHALDHLDRLAEVAGHHQEFALLQNYQGVTRRAAEAAESLGQVRHWLQGHPHKSLTTRSSKSESQTETVDGLAMIKELSQQTADWRRKKRPRVIARIAEGQKELERSLGRLTAMRQLDRILFHLWRILEHLSGATRTVLESDEHLD